MHYFASTRYFSVAITFYLIFMAAMHLLFSRFCDFFGRPSVIDVGHRLLLLFSPQTGFSLIFLGDALL